MPQTVNEWLPVIAAIGTALSAIIVWGFWSGKFVQKHTDEIDDVRQRQLLAIDRVTTNEKSIADIKDALFKLREETNRDMGRLSYKADLLEERVSVLKVHSDERYERIEAQIEKIEAQVDHLKSSDDPPDRRHRR